jgi:T5SS/PEP-CTERM-associated repeat protein
MQTHACSKISVLVVAIGSAFISISAAHAQISTTGDVSPSIGPVDTDFGAVTLFIGNTTTGTVSVINGATLTGDSVFLGETATGNGTMTVNGIGSEVIADGRLRIGRNGIGVLNVQAGAVVSSLGGSASSTRIADFPGSSGTVNVDGGIFNVNRSDGAPNLGVGHQSTGVLNVTNAGRVTLGNASSGTGLENGATLQIGSANFTSGPVTNAQGSALVSGAGSVVELLGSNANLNVGRMGSGTTGLLTVQNGGAVSAGIFLGIGRGREGEQGFGATGTVIVDGIGSRIDVAGVRTCCTDANNGASIQVGAQDGTGTLTIRNGGLVKLDTRGATGAQSGGVTVARDALSTGVVNIESNGRLELISDTTNDSFGMVVGRAGSGTLNVKSGGQLSITNTGVAGLGLTFGGNADVSTGGTFSGLISGVGTTLTLRGVSGTLTVGRNAGSSGTVTIEAGALATLANRISVGTNTGASGILNITGAGTIVNLKSLPADQFGAGLTVARSGTGTANISAGAVVNVDGSGGAQRHSTNVGGSGTSSGGNGTLNVTGAATRYNVTGASTSLVIGRDDSNGSSPSHGNMTISDGAQVSFPSTGTGSVGHSPGSSGVLTVTGAGSRLNMGAFLGVGRDFDDNPGGTGTLNVGAGGVVQATAVHIGTSGTLAGNGSIDGTVTNDGVIMPGASPGTLSISGDLLLSDSSLLVIEIGGTAPGQYDVITIGGALALDGTLRLVRDGSYAPRLGDAFSVLSFASSSGNFDKVLLEGFGAGVDFSGKFDGNAFQITAVPEPHEWALMLGGLAAIRLATRGRSKPRGAAFV